MYEGECACMRVGLHSCASLYEYASACPSAIQTILGCVLQQLLVACNTRMWKNWIHTFVKSCGIALRDGMHARGKNERSKAM